MATIQHMFDFLTFFFSDKMNKIWPFINIFNKQMFLVWKQWNCTCVSSPISSKLTCAVRGCEWHHYVQPPDEPIGGVKLTRDEMQTQTNTPVQCLQTYKTDHSCLQVWGEGDHLFCFTTLCKYWSWLME